MVNTTHPHPHRLARLPPWISRWLGYRPTPPPPLPPYQISLWSFIGAFCGLASIQAVFGQSHYFVARGVPSIIASFGASAVLVYGAIESPLAQPRPLIAGHFISALTGICISKLFSLIPSPPSPSWLWLPGTLSSALSIVLMHLTGTTHPPAGATALLASTNPDIQALGFYYLPVTLLSSFIILAVALVVNNVQRRYPMFWFRPAVVVPAAVEPALGGPEVDGGAGGEGGEREKIGGATASSVEDTQTQTQTQQSSAKDMC